MRPLHLLARCLLLSIRLLLLFELELRLHRTLAPSTLGVRSVRRPRGRYVGWWWGLAAWRQPSSLPPAVARVTSQLIPSSANVSGMASASPWHGQHHSSLSPPALFRALDTFACQEQVSPSALFRLLPQSYAPVQQLLLSPSCLTPSLKKGTYWCLSSVQMFSFIIANISKAQRTESWQQFC